MGKGKKTPNSVEALASTLQRLAMQQPLVAAKKKRKKRNKRKRTGLSGNLSNEDSQMRISRVEMVSNLTTTEKGVLVGHIDVLPSSFSFLKTLGSMFDRVRWERMSFHYKPAVGSTVGGLVSLGMDWDFNGGDVAREKISGYSPNTTFAVWNDTEKNPLILPSGKLMSRNWYTPNYQSATFIDRGPGKLHYAVSGPKSTVVGEIWVSYTVTMAGTTPS